MTARILAVLLVVVTTAALSRLTRSSGARLNVVVFTIFSPKAQGCPIIVPARAIDGERRAAAELQHTFAQTSGLGGAAFPIVAEERATPRCGVYVGATVRAGDFLRRTHQPPRDTTVGALVRDGAVFIRSERRESIESAVGWFLEQQLGAHWFIPGPLGEVVPARTELTLDAGEFRASPGFVHRDLGTQGGEANRAWYGLNKLEPRFEHSHNLVNIFRPEDFRRIPEMAPIRNGARFIPAATSGNWQPNMLSPAAVKHAAAVASRAFDTDPKRLSFSLSINDSDRFDESPATLAAVSSANFPSSPLSPLPPVQTNPGQGVSQQATEATERAQSSTSAFSSSPLSPLPPVQTQSGQAVSQQASEGNSGRPGPRFFRHRPDYSPLVFRFTNSVAERVAQQYPNRYLPAYAYYWCENAPLFPIARNVVPFLTADRSRWSFPEFAAEDRGLIERWCRSGAEIVGVYDYFEGAPYLCPRPTLYTVAQSIPFEYKAGIRAFYGEGSPNWALDGPKLWLAAQLLWSPESDQPSPASLRTRDQGPRTKDSRSAPLPPVKSDQTKAFEQEPTEGKPITNNPQPITAHVSSPRPRTPAELLDIYYREFWAEAAGPMREFFALCEEVWQHQPGPPLWLRYYGDEDQAYIYTPEQRARLRIFLAAAERAARSDAVRARVAFTSNAFAITEKFADFCAAREELHRMTQREISPESMSASLPEKSNSIKAFAQEATEGTAPSATSSPLPPFPPVKTPTKAVLQETTEGTERIAATGTVTADVPPSPPRSLRPPVNPNQTNAVSQELAERAENTRATGAQPITAPANARALITAWKRYIEARSEFTRAYEELTRAHPLALGSQDINIYLRNQPDGRVARALTQTDAARATLRENEYLAEVYLAATESQLSALFARGVESLFDPGWQHVAMRPINNHATNDWTAPGVPWQGTGEAWEGRTVEFLTNARGERVLKIASCRTESLGQWAGAVPNALYAAQVHVRAKTSPGTATFLIVNFLNADERHVGLGRSDRLPPTSPVTYPAKAVLQDAAEGAERVRTIFTATSPTSSQRSPVNPNQSKAASQKIAESAERDSSPLSPLPPVNPNRTTDASGIQETDLCVVIRAPANAKYIGFAVQAWNQIDDDFAEFSRASLKRLVE